MNCTAKRCQLHGRLVWLPQRSRPDLHVVHSTVAGDIEALEHLLRHLRWRQSV